MIDITIKGIDFELLNEQRLELIESLWSDPESKLWGLVEMLDYIYDTYGGTND